MSTFRRPIDNAESLRSTRRSLGDGTVTGRSRLAMPPQNKARGTGFQRLTVPGIDGSPLGETITVQAINVPITTTAELVTFDGEPLGENEGFVYLPPTVDIQPTIRDAYYDIHVEIGRGGYEGTVKVEVLRGSTVVWPLRSPSYWDNPQVPVSAKGRLIDRDLSPWRVRITGSTGGTLAYVLVQAELVDRPRPGLFVPPEPPESSVGTANTLALRLGETESTTVATPGDTEVGDLLVAMSITTGNSSASNITGHLVPAGWTEAYDSGFIDYPSGSRRARMRIHYRFATAGDVGGGADYTWSVVGNDGYNKSVSVSMLRWAGAAFLNPPFDAAIADSFLAPDPRVMAITPPDTRPAALVFGAVTRSLLTTGSSTDYSWGIAPADPPLALVGAYSEGDLSGVPNLNFTWGNPAARRAGFHFHYSFETGPTINVTVGDPLTHGWLVALPIRV